MDRCDFALSMGLATEAIAAAEQAVTEFEQARQPADVAEARLLLAQSALLSGEPVRARAAADESARAFAEQRRPRWAVVARYTGLLARLAGAVDRVPAQEVVRAANALQRAGWATWAVDARLIAGRMELGYGHTTTGRRQLRFVSRWRTRGTARQRAQGWHAEALLRMSTGDRRGAHRAVLRGLAILREHHSLLGATDLRASAAGSLTDLAQLGLKIAVEGRPHTVLAAAERVRAAHLLRRPVRPPGDDLLARDLADLRHVGAELRKAVASGRPTEDLRRRRVVLERAVRDRCRLAEDNRHTTVSPPGTRALTERLGECALIEYVQVDDDLLALTLVAGRLRLHRLGQLAPLHRELRALPFLLRRLALRTGPATSLQAAALGAEHAARTLDDALIRPLLAHIGDRSLVVVPSSGLEALCWSLLPSCRQRPLSVAPSATLWHRAVVRDRASAGGPVVLVAGPGLPGANVEIQLLASLYPDPGALVGDAATVQRVTAALDGAHVAHLATHGTLRSDNPQFSCLELSDGPLTVYDLEQLACAPRYVLLSACDTGRGSVLPGGAVLGLVGAFLALGTTALIASVLPVSDPDLPRLMVDLHVGLRSGQGPAAALAAAQSLAYQRGDTALAASLVCFGAG